LLPLPVLSELVLISLWSGGVGGQIGPCLSISGLRLVPPTDSLSAVELELPLTWLTVGTVAPS
jgi:hypothetical protein